MSAARLVLSMVGASIFAFAAIFGLVLATGQTFGQRCAVQHERGSAGWERCVDGFTRRDR